MVTTAKIWDWMWDVVVESLPKWWDSFAGSGVENDADEDDDNDADDEDMASPTGVSSVSLMQFRHRTWEIHTGALTVRIPGGVFLAPWRKFPTWV